MKLISQIIERKIMNADESLMNNKNIVDVLSSNYEAINLAYAFAPQPVNISLRNNLWHKVLRNDKKAILVMRRLMYKDRRIALNLLQKIKAKESKEVQIGNLWKKGRFAVLDYEYE